MGAGLSLTLLPAFGTLPPTGSPCSALMKGGAYSYCNFIGHVWLISKRGLLFLNRNKGVDVVYRVGGCGGTGRRGIRENCGQDGGCNCKIIIILFKRHFSGPF